MRERAAKVLDEYASALIENKGLINFPWFVASIHDKINALPLSPESG